MYIITEKYYFDGRVLLHFQQFAESARQAVQKLKSITTKLDCNTMYMNKF